VTFISMLPGFIPHTCHAVYATCVHPIRQAPSSYLHYSLSPTRSVYDVNFLHLYQQSFSLFSDIISLFLFSCYHFMVKIKICTCRPTIITYICSCAVSTVHCLASSLRFASRGINVCLYANMKKIVCISFQPLMKLNSWVVLSFSAYRFRL